MPTLDQCKNFAKGTVSTGYDASATTIVLATNEGNKFPSFAGNPYNVVWWNSTDFADPADDPTAEIVRVTGRTGDSLTVTRGQEGTSSTTHNSSSKVYKMALCLTKKMIDDIEAVTTGLTKCAFRAGLATGGQYVPGSWTRILFTEIFDDGVGFDSLNNMFTASMGGLYFFMVSIEGVLETNKVITLSLHLNFDTLMMSTSGVISSASRHRACVYTMSYLAPGDVVYAATTTDNSTNVHIDGDGTQFIGFCVYGGT